MSFPSVTRRDSWPPTRTHLTNDPSNTTTRQELQAAIDENPFSFFLTSPDELDIDDYLSDDDLNAGIETPDSSRSPVREVSPSSLQRHPLPIPTHEEDIVIREDSDEDNEEYDFGGFGMAIPISLKEYSRNTTSSGRKSRTEMRDENEKDVGLGITLPDFSARGRARVKLVPTRGRGRGSRSLSARRPASWRAPSPEIFPIKEERESDEEEKENAKKGLDVRFDEEVYSVSAPASSRIGSGGLASPRLGLKEKVKKRVHWAM